MATKSINNYNPVVINLTNNSFLRIYKDKNGVSIFFYYTNENRKSVIDTIEDKFKENLKEIYNVDSETISMLYLTDISVGEVVRGLVD